MKRVLSRDPLIEAVSSDHGAVWRIWYTDSGCHPSEDRLNELKRELQRQTSEHILLDVDCGRAGLITMLVCPATLRDRTSETVENSLRFIAMVLRASCPECPDYAPQLDLIQILIDQAAH